MSDGEQEARIALLQEYGSNIRNWYNVLLTLAIVFFAVVQVRSTLQDYGVSLCKVTLDGWAFSVAALASQAIYAVVRAAVHVKLAETVVAIEIPHPQFNYLKALRDQTEEKIGKNTSRIHRLKDILRICKCRKVSDAWKLTLGQLGIWLGSFWGWVVWTLPSVLAILAFLIGTMPYFVLPKPPS